MESVGWSTTPASPKNTYVCAKGSTYNSSTGVRVITAAWVPTATFYALLSYYYPEGMVPVRTLGLPDDYAIDGWGRRIFYGMDNRFATIGAFSLIGVNDSTARISILPTNSRYGQNDLCGPMSCSVMVRTDMCLAAERSGMTPSVKLQTTSVRACHFWCAIQTSCKSHMLIANGYLPRFSEGGSIEQDRPGKNI